MLLNHFKYILELDVFGQLGFFVFQHCRCRHHRLFPHFPFSNGNLSLSPSFKLVGNAPLIFSLWRWSLTCCVVCLQTFADLYLGSTKCEHSWECCTLCAPYHIVAMHCLVYNHSVQDCAQPLIYIVPNIVLCSVLIVDGPELPWPELCKC